MLLLNTVLLMAQPVGRAIKAVMQGGKNCIQQGETAQMNGPRTYLSLEVKASKSGSFKVMRAAELPGSVRLNSAPTSDYIYEVSNGKQTIAAAFLRDDPFAVRGFADPSSDQGENIERQEAATFIINIPAFGLSMLEKNQLGLRLYKVRPGVKVDSMDAGVFLHLRDGGSLTPVLFVAATKFTEAIKKAAKARV
jgi:hypothetical protein